MKRHHPHLVALHWLLALMIIVALVMGGIILGKTPNSDPEKIGHLQTHMSLGTLILILMVARFAVRLLKPRPAPAESGNPVLKWLGPLVHYLFYLVVIAMASSGLATAILAGLPEIVFGGTGEPLPASFDDIPPRAAHGILSILLMILIVLHLAGFVFHQFIRKDHLFERMWFARKSGGEKS
ncbi:MAG: cytochrome b/b6 domain-containing protein [Rhodospirillales bacterium]|jgi:cytochrome b561|nr:cytochrome b/b6 domain-containing protein [Rhodospirillales bacterium]